MQVLIKSIPIDPDGFMRVRLEGGRIALIRLVNYQWATGENTVCMWALKDEIIEVPDRLIPDYVHLPNLGEIVGKFLEIEMDEAESHEDVRQWHAPSECHGDVTRSYDRARKRLCDELRDNGVSYRILAENLLNRLPQRWLFDRGLSYLI